MKRKLHQQIYVLYGCLTYPVVQPDASYAAGHPVVQPGALMHNLSGPSYPVVQLDGLKATRLYNQVS